MRVNVKTCRITQTGARSTSSPLAALRSLSFNSFGKFSAVKEVISEGCVLVKGMQYIKLSFNHRIRVLLLK